MKYFIVVGEPSGDLHAANLIAALKQEDDAAEFRFWGGDKMQEAAGIAPLKHYRELAFMGFVEVVQNIGAILGNLKLCKKQIKEYQPDVVILVDYPGFNLKIAKAAHYYGFKVFYYISPKIWAWKQRRVYDIKKYVDMMFSILPFETKFYQKYGVEVHYIGNPLMDNIQKYKDETKESMVPRDKPVIALLPGSREQELRRILPDMLSVMPDFPGYSFVVAATTALDRELYNEIIGTRSVHLVFDRAYDVLEHAEAALVASGTATLETALLNIPQVVCYKANQTSYNIAKRVVSIKYISLVNLVLDREAVRELIQKDLNTVNLKEELLAIVKGGSKREKMLADYTELRNMIGGPGASERAAKLMVEHLKSTL
jgi:lipid-A-disaccharide synthase